MHRLRSLELVLQRLLCLWLAIKEELALRKALPLIGSLAGLILTCMQKSSCGVKGFGCGVWKEGDSETASICWSTSLEVSQSRLSRLCPGEVPVPSAGVMCSASPSHLSIGIQCCSSNQYGHAGECCMSCKDHHQLSLAIVVSRSRTELAESTNAGTSTRPSLASHISNSHFTPCHAAFLHSSPSLRQPYFLHLPHQELASTL